MLYQHPIYPLVITAFTLIFVVLQSIQNEKVLKNRLTITFINLTIIVVVFVVSFQNPEMIETGSYHDLYIGFTFFTYFIFFVTLYTMFKSSNLKSNHYQLFVKSIRNSRFNAYYVVDKRERIKDISTSLLQELDMEKDEVMGKKLFSVFNKAIRFTKLNQTEVNNRSLETFYLDYRKRAKPNESEIQELMMLNADGNQILLHMVMQPVFSMGKYKGRMCIGEKKSDFDLIAVEKELNERNTELESIRHKFIATLEISEEGLFYIDIDERTIWASDTLVDMLKLPSNLLDLTDFRRLIEPEDLKKYLAILGELTINKKQYKTTFRLMINGRYMWFKEKGKRLFEDQHSAIIMGTLNPMKTKHFKSSNIDELDELRDQHDLLVTMKKRFDENKYFELVVFHLKNMPKVNEQFGREVGNMLMAEYIKKMRQTFVTESGDIFRINGIEFAVLITDPRKIETLAMGIKGNKAFLNLKMQYGSIHTELEVFAGIAVGPSDADDEHKLYQAAAQALKIAENPQYEAHCCYYKDIVS